MAKHPHELNQRVGGSIPSVRIPRHSTCILRLRLVKFSMHIDSPYEMKRLTQEEKDFITGNQTLSLDQLAKKLKRPKTTIYFHLRKLRGPLGPSRKNATPKLPKTRRKLSQSAESKLRRSNAARVAANAMHEGKRSEASRQAKAIWELHKENADFLIGLTMYWCEGTKRDMQFTNSDPAMIRFMLHWVTEYIPHKEVRWELRGPSEDHRKQVEAFWQREVPEIKQHRWYTIKMRKPNGLALLSLRTNYRQSTFIALLLQLLAQHLDRS